MMRRSKFNVDQQDKSCRTFDNIVFDSAVEMRYYKEIILPGAESGKISHFERQKKYELQPAYICKGKKIRAIEYVADFYVEYSDGREAVVDIKGYPDNIAKIKRKMFSYKYPNIEYLWVGYSKSLGGWKTYEEIQAAQKFRRLARKHNKEIKG